MTTNHVMMPIKDLIKKHTDLKISDLQLSKESTRCGLQAKHIPHALQFHLTRRFDNVRLSLLLAVACQAC